MSLSELLLTLLVALIVFGPNKLPLLAHHLGKLVGRFQHYKQQIATVWQQQLKEQQLQDNIKKAQLAETSQPKHGEEDARDATSTRSTPN